MAVSYPIVLSITEPNNSIGILKIRQSDEETQKLIVEITESGNKKSYEGLQVFFCAKIGQTIGLGVVEQKLKQDEMVDPKNGMLEYTFRKEDWQYIGRQTGYFSFRKMIDDHTYVQQFSTRDFDFTITKSAFSDGIRELKSDGSTYIWTFEDLLRLLEEFKESGEADFLKWYEEIKDQLSEDAAGNLMLLYQSLREKTGTDSDFRDFESSLSFMRRVYNEQNERGINPLWFGVKLDGTTDDTLNFKSLLGLPQAKKIVFPHNSTIYITDKVEVPEGTVIDFQNTTIYAKQSIEVTPLIVTGSNVQLKNVTIVQKDYNYNAKSGVAGVEVKSNTDVSNILIENVNTYGFEDGIRISPDDGYLANRVTLQNCGTFYAELAGINLLNCKNPFLLNCYSEYNRTDGLKVTKNVRGLVVDGGSYSYNVNHDRGYADGIDLYAGARQTVIKNVVCEDNAGMGIHAMNGELNDPEYVDYVGQKVDRLVFDTVTCKNNGASGMDVTVKDTVSANAPYVAKTIISNSHFFGNQKNGIDLKTRDFNVLGCIISGNAGFGINIEKSTFGILSDNQVISNSRSNMGAYSGINILNCQYIQINGGIINGSDREYIQNGTGEGLDKYHKHGILIDNIEGSNHIYINNPIIINSADPRLVFPKNYEVASNSIKDIIVKLYDIGDKLVAFQYGNVGSEIFKDGKKYIKKTNLNSNVWESLT